MRELHTKRSEHFGSFNLDTFQPKWQHHNNLSATRVRTPKVVSRTTSKVLRNRKLLLHLEARRSAIGMLDRPMNLALEETLLHQERQQVNIQARRRRKRALDTDTQHKHRSHPTACSSRRTVVTRLLKLKRHTSSPPMAHREDMSHHSRAMRQLLVVAMFSSKACRA